MKMLSGLILKASGCINFEEDLKHYIAEIQTHASIAWHSRVEQLIPVQTHVLEQPVDQRVGKRLMQVCHIGPLWLGNDKRCPQPMQAELHGMGIA